MAALLAKFLEHPEISLGVAAFGVVKKLQTTQEGRITSFVLPGAICGTAAGLSMCRDLVNEWKPDLLHIHGTENNFGLLSARNLVECPTVISIQGLLGPCSEWYRYFGNCSLIDIFNMHRFLEIPALRGHWMEFLKIRKMAKVERETIAGNRFFLGRTAWDRAYIRAQNPSACYFHGGELLREPFWHKRWDMSRSTRHRVFFTNAGHPRKGAQVVFAAVKLLQADYPDIQVVIAGGISHRSGYGRYIRAKIKKIGVVRELGALNAEQMAEELLSAHVFVTPSFIENSSNACCEAQLLGMPVLSSYTGGMSSLVDDGRTGLFFPTGDAPMLAARLREVFENDELAMQLGTQAHEVACRRHDPVSVVQGILDVYKDIIKQTQ